MFINIFQLMSAVNMRALPDSGVLILIFILMNFFRKRQDLDFLINIDAGKDEYDCTITY